jgi:hypothetical protein
MYNPFGSPLLMGRVKNTANCLERTGQNDQQSCSTLLSTMSRQDDSPEKAMDTSVEQEGSQGYVAYIT